jgi:hypothetical protein
MHRRVSPEHHEQREGPRTAHACESHPISPSEEIEESQSYTLLCAWPRKQTIGDAKVIYADCQDTIEELIIYVKAKNDLQESEKPGNVSLLEDLANRSESLRHERLRERLMDMTEAELYRFVNREQ